MGGLTLIQLDALLFLTDDLIRLLRLPIPDSIPLDISGSLLRRRLCSAMSIKQSRSHRAKEKTRREVI